jgi:hypothetical protein
MSAIVDCVTEIAPVAAVCGAQISAAWRKSVEAIIETGQLLIGAKTTLAHGQFELMVKTCCPFGKRTAQTLMAIASHPVLSNAQHVARLPAAWGTLGELARFEPDELDHAIRNYWVKPELKREEVSKLRKRVRVAFGRQSPRRTFREPTQALTVEEEVSRFARRISDEIKKRLVEVPEFTIAINDGNTAEYIDVMVAALEKHITERGEAAIGFVERLGERAA